MTLTQAAYLHTLDPVIFNIAGDFAIRWYGLAYAAGFFGAFLLGRRLSRTGRISLSVEQVSDLIFYAIIGTLVGGRLGWVLFYNPKAFLTFTAALPYWEVLAINRGGMASHGGMIGVFLALFLGAKRHRIRPFVFIDLASLLAPIGFFFGRIANFINGELRGKPCDESFPLAVKFPHEIQEDWGIRPFIEIKEAATHIGYSNAEWQSVLIRASNGTEEALANYALLKERVVATIMSEAGQPESMRFVTDIVQPFLVARHPSQLYQAAAEGIVLGAVLWGIFLLFPKRKPGVILFSFGVVYAGLRVLTEVWRLPDVGIDIFWGLSRGQWLSVALGVAGIAGLIWLWRAGCGEESQELTPDP